MQTYRCPICGHILSKSDYEKVLKIHEAQQRHLQHLEAKLERDRQEILRQRASLKSKVADARKEAQRKERDRVNRLMAGQVMTIQRLQQRIHQLEKGSTPQTEGLEFEAILVKRLRRQFPGDEIRHEGKAGDILQSVRLNDEIAGTIVYECKRTPRIDTSHIRQAHEAKQSRDAEFAVLVTTGKRKGFSGLAHMGGVLVVAPLGVIALASLLREHLGEMVKARITHGKRALIAQRLLLFITSPQFKNPIDETIQRATQLQDLLIQEAKEHFRVWKKRWEQYQTIEWKSSQVQGNVQLVLRGGEPEAKIPKVTPLQLPASND
jgi:hypothetical protein